MSRFVRHLLVWIVAALLPLQGYAAAAMISCGPMHAQAAGQSHHHADHEGHEGHHQEHEGKASPELFKFKCSACAACCTGTLGPSYLAPFPGVMPAHPVAIPFSGWMHDGIVLDALERPPRTFLA